LLGGGGGGYRSDIILIRPCLANDGDNDPSTDVETLSLVTGTAELPLLEHTIGTALELAVARWPHAEALVSCHQGIRWTWLELSERVDDLAAGLLALGLQRGDRVGSGPPIASSGR